MEDKEKIKNILDRYDDLQSKVDIAYFEIKNIIKDNYGTVEAFCDKINVGSCSLTNNLKMSKKYIKLMRKALLG